MENGKTICPVIIDGKCPTCDWVQQLYAGREFVDYDRKPSRLIGKLQRDFGKRRTRKRAK